MDAKQQDALDSRVIDTLEANRQRLVTLASSLATKQELSGPDIVAIAAGLQDAESEASA